MLAFYCAIWHNNGKKQKEVIFLERLQDPALLTRLLHGLPFADCFASLPADLELRRYQRGELLSTPVEPLRCFYLILQGQIRIYGLREDGGSFAVYTEERGALLGDMEFCQADFEPFYVEAAGEVLCAALPMEAHRAQLSAEPRFLWLLLHSLTQKVSLVAHLDRPAQTLTDRLLTFLQDIQPDHTLHSIREGVSRLHCSRRQLQRVVAALCTDGRMKKTGKGRYRLA